jgi:hypothetical protein
MGFIMAIQDKVIPVKNYRKFILKEDLQDDTCRRCEKVPETIEHITGSCTSPANMQYLHRHNNTVCVTLCVCVCFVFCIGILAPSACCGL